MTNYLDRFLTAQENTYADALAEIRSGEKRSHWIWFIFPQLHGLGSSSMAVYYGIPDLETAAAYVHHPVLGARLREITRALLELPQTDITRILPWPDDLKVRSCMTLFSLAAPEESLFPQVLDKYYGGTRCEKTLMLLDILNGAPVLEPIEKPAFAVIGIEGSTGDGPDFITNLWQQANSRFGEVAALAKRRPNGSLYGVWGAMSDLSRSFLPWEDHFTRGLYLAGVEVNDDALPPPGWVRWDIPGYEYMRVEKDAPDTFPRVLEELASMGLTLAGAVHDFTDPATGTNYMYFPIRKL